jgi:regulator of cell morphogenesis and NO signaling
LQHGHQTLEEACSTKAIDQNEVLSCLKENDAKAVLDTSTVTWLNATLTELADHIQQTHHAYLKTELPRLRELAYKVARVHGAKEPRLVKVASIFNAMKEEIEHHTFKEEMVLFPYIRKLDDGKRLPPTPFGSVSNPIRCMQSEHDEAGEALIQLRELTDHYTAPEHACTSWRALLGGLEHLDRDLRTHIHKENTILFPKAIEAEERLAAV